MARLRYLAAAALAWVALSLGVLAQPPTLPGFAPGMFQNRATVGSSAPTAMSMVMDKTAQKYLTTTWSHAPTDGKKATITYWFKWTNVGGLTADNYMYATAYNGTALLDHKYDGMVHFRINDDVASSYLIFDGGATFPDTNWHHLCIRIDTTQATAANRVHIEVDGVDSGLDAGSTLPSLNEDMGVTGNALASYLGTIGYNLGVVSDVKLAYVYVIDGQALPASSFTTGTGAGSIHPITYSGTYGANGTFLNGNGSTLTDQSGAGNSWTAPNGITFSSDLPL